MVSLSWKRSIMWPYWYANNATKIKKFQTGWGKRAALWWKWIEIEIEWELIEITNRQVTLSALAGSLARAAQDADNFHLSVYYAVIVTLKN